MGEDALSRIHSTAVVSAQANLAEGVCVGPHCVIGEGVTIGEDTRIGPLTVIQGPTEIGSRNQIFGQAAIGTDPQDLKFKGEKSFLRIGDDNIIREFVTLNRGTEGGGGKTEIGNQNLLMTGVHIAHDCLVGDQTILANSATLAGHVQVSSGATVGAFSGIHQFCRVGQHAFIGGYSVITRDALPYIKTVGIRNDARTYDVNSIGLERCGFSLERIEALKKAYRQLFRGRAKVKDAMAALRTEEMTEEVGHLLEFIESSDRGFVR